VHVQQLTLTQALRKNTELVRGAQSPPKDETETIVRDAI
jgi:hypothetical protein